MINYKNIYLNNSEKDWLTSICNFFKPLKKKREEEVTPDPDPEPEDPDSKLNVTITTSEPANNEYYELGEIITYEINIQNSGNLTISDITVNVQVNNVNQEPIHINKLDVEETTTSQVEHTVTEEDILAHEILLSATATGNTSSGTVSSSNSVTNYPADPNGRLRVVGQTTSTAANGESYALGETITYEVHVLNDGNLTISNITLTCEMTDDEWQIESLAPEESTEPRVISYEVQEDDILAREVVNTVTATGESPDPDEPEVPVEPAVIPEPTEDPLAEITINSETTSEPDNGESYQLGETIVNDIYIENSGNLTISNITVGCELTGDNWDWPGRQLSPGENKTLSAEHLLVEEDINAGSVTFDITVTGTTELPDSEEFEATENFDVEL